MPTKMNFGFLFKMEQFANKNNTCYKENLISACYFTFFLIFLEKTKMLAFFYLSRPDRLYNHVYCLKKGLIEL